MEGGDTGEADVEVEEVADDGANEGGGEVDCLRDFDDAGGYGHDGAGHDREGTKEEEESEVFPAAFETPAEAFDLRVRHTNHFAESPDEQVLCLVGDGVDDQIGRASCR